MFEQHPVPQQISSYQFRLVGDMTIKQFFQIAAGGVVALIIYGMPFPGFVKWPLIIIAALSGAAFAFLPIQDRPLEQWLFAFIRSIYSPTYFVWQKKGPPPQYFKVDANTSQTPAQISLEQQHAEDLKNGVEIVQDAGIPDFITGRNAQTDETPMDQNSQPQQMQGTSVSSRLQSDVDSSLQQGQVVPETDQPVDQERPEVKVPEKQVVEVEKKGFEEPEKQIYSNENQIQTTQVGQVLSQNPNQAQVPVQQAQFSPDAAPPLPPEQANIIKGQVMDSSGHIIDGAILEIKDVDGRPVRAIRSNKAGHFQIVTSLPNGVYKLIIDKEGYEFDPVSIEAKGEIIHPIAIRARG